MNSSVSILDLSRVGIVYENYTIFMCSFSSPQLRIGKIGIYARIVSTLAVYSEVFFSCISTTPVGVYTLA
jgi:hypothetical protein